MKLIALLALIFLRGDAFAQIKYATLFGMITPENVIISQQALLEQQQQKRVVRLLVNSAGGEVFSAKNLAKTMRGMYVDCYVIAAGSAALQVILPACSRVIFNTDSSIAFHAVHLHGTINISQIQEAITVFNTEETEMSKNVQEAFGKAKCPKNTQYSKIVSGDCVRQLMLLNQIWGPHEFNYYFPNNKTILIDKIMFDTLLNIFLK